MFTPGKHGCQFCYLVCHIGTLIPGNYPVPDMDQP